MAQRSVPKRSLSSDYVGDPPTNVTKAIGDKRLSVYLKATPLFQLVVGLFSTPLTGPRIFKKAEIQNSNRVTDHKRR